MENRRLFQLCCVYKSVMTTYINASIGCPMSTNLWKRLNIFVISTNIPCPDISLKIIILSNKPGNQNTLNVMLNSNSNLFWIWIKHRMISIAIMLCIDPDSWGLPTIKQTDAFLNGFCWRSVILKQNENVWGLTCPKVE